MGAAGGCRRPPLSGRRFGTRLGGAAAAPRRPLAAAALGARGDPRRRRGARRAGRPRAGARRRGRRPGGRAAPLRRGHRGAARPARRGRGAPRAARPAEAQARRHDRGGARARRGVPPPARRAGGRRGGARGRRGASSRPPAPSSPSWPAGCAPRGARRPARWRSAVVERLAGLAMEGASFEARVTERDGYGPTGGDEVEFLIAPNPGVPAGPLRETASGGELSRVMLALMGVAAEAGPAHAGLRRGRRRHRRPDRPRGRRAAARARGRPPDHLHHPPAADRLARRPPLHDRQGHVGRHRPHHRHPPRARRRRRRARAHARRRGRRRRRPPPRPRAAQGGVTERTAAARALDWPGRRIANA